MSVEDGDDGFPSPSARVSSKIYFESRSTGESFPVFARLTSLLSFSLFSFSYSL